MILNRKEGDLFKNAMMVIIPVVYIALILSLGFLGYNIFSAPVEEGPPPEDVVLIHVSNEREETMTVTVELISQQDYPGSMPGNHTFDITDFDEKGIEYNETVTFSSSGHSYYNYPMELRVFRTDEGEELLETKSIRLTVGQSSGNERGFEVTI